MASDPAPVVRCADDFKKLYPKNTFRQIAGFIALFAACGLLSHWLGWGWINAIPVVSGICFVIPILWKQQRFLRSLQCPHCGQSAGETFTKSGILHLRCRHCGQETKTDCLMLAGPPTKV
jgi:hypothetical protein